MTKRVRFAPSPTGFLHIGNARAAVLNWLFAQKYDAEYMLRLDDTDHERSTKEFADQISKDLAWLGIKPHSFAKQSDRLDRYNEAIEFLKAQGHLYPCYETPDELDFKRKRQLARGEPPIYDRAALALSDAEKVTLEAKGIMPHWRFKLVDEDVSWEDGIRGKVLFQGRNMSDPVLIKTDGQPVYTLASVVDDIDFQMTDIIRGEDHVTNSAVQLQIFMALGGNPASIRLSHFSLITNATGQGFSKREGSLSLKTLAEDGLDSMTIVSLIARLGTSTQIYPTHNMRELIDEFDLDHFSRSSPKFDPNDLIKLNQTLLHHMPYDVAQGRMSPSQLERMSVQLWQVIQGNISKISEVEEWADIVQNGPKSIQGTMDKTVIQKALECYPSEKMFDEQTWTRWTAAISEALGIKGKSLYLPLRLALTGAEHGPQMQLLLPIIGTDSVRKRLEDTLV
ncbi:MAG: glutamate--tRNA ligase [Alphaproteobacteria bacterium]|nr:glutamate--tRNA ligase [Alphaproteobacteria bacterium]OJV47316.1 MAG: glutamate--tRNA ligase [Alphaproteobacteria bacterium 43-37]